MMRQKISHQSPKGFGSIEHRQNATLLLRRKAQADTQGYPIATIAYYGPDEDTATKVAVGIVDQSQEVIDLKRWLADGTEIRMDDTVNRQILDFVKRKRAKRVIMTDGIIGCPHEEGIDYPEGENCPECPYWADKR